MRYFVIHFYLKFYFLILESAWITPQAQPSDSSTRLSRPCKHKTVSNHLVYSQFTWRIQIILLLFKQHKSTNDTYFFWCNSSATLTAYSLVSLTIPSSCCCLSLSYFKYSFILSFAHISSSSTILLYSNSFISAISNFLTLSCSSCSISCTIKCCFLT